MKVHIDIGLLLLDGVSVAPRERPLLLASVKEELARLVHEQGAASGIPVPTYQRSRSVGPIRLRSIGGQQDLGVRIASAVYAALPGRSTNRIGSRREEASR